MKKIISLLFASIFFACAGAYAADFSGTWEKVETARSGGRIQILLEIKQEANGYHVSQRKVAGWGRRNIQLNEFLAQDDGGETLQLNNGAHSTISYNPDGTLIVTDGGLIGGVYRKLP